jgi:hypothetical protein
MKPEPQDGMSFGSPRTGPNLRLKRGLKKRLSIGQQSWTKGRRKASKLSNNCHARGRANDTPTPPWTPTNFLTKPGHGPEPAPSASFNSVRKPPLSRQRVTHSRVNQRPPCTKAGLRQVLSDGLPMSR